MNSVLRDTPPTGWQTLEHFSFGDHPALADELLDLVLSGRKTATCWSALDGQQTCHGQRSVVCDGSGRPRAILETTSLVSMSFDQVTEDFARKEGEGDLSLAHWRREHRRYFERRGQFAETMDLWCEEFAIVHVF